MSNGKALREHLLNILKGEGAHVDFEAAVKDLPANLRGRRPEGAGHSPWEVLEHLRITQWDILEFIRNPKHVSPEFPKGYWPTSETPPSDKAWDQAVAGFRGDLQAFCNLVANDSADPMAPIPHADGKTILREVLLAADHNSYHLGELVLLRRLLGAWR